MCSTDIFLGLLALLFPPLPVWVKCGICSADSIINILLCVLGYIPGLLHAWYIIAKYPEPAYDYETVPNSDSERGGRVTYVFVHSDERDNLRAQRSQAPKPQSGMNYGAMNNAAGSSSAPAPQQPPRNANAGEGSSDAPPPSYAQVVAGDNKVQSHD